MNPSKQPCSLAMRGPDGRPPDETIRRHQAPPSSANTVATKHWFFGTVCRPQGHGKVMS